MLLGCDYMDQGYMAVPPDSPTNSYGRINVEAVAARRAALSQIFGIFPGHTSAKLPQPRKTRKRQSEFCVQIRRSARLRTTSASMADLDSGEFSDSGSSESEHAFAMDVPSEGQALKGKGARDWDSEDPWPNSKSDSGDDSACDEFQTVLTPRHKAMQPPKQLRPQISESLYFYLSP